MNLSGMPAMPVGGRAAQVRSLLEAEGLDALVVTSDSNRRWLTGFTGSNGVVVVTADSLALFTDGRYAEQAPLELAAAGVDADLTIGADLVQGAANAAAAKPRVGLEADEVVWAVQRRLSSAIDGDVVATAGLMAGLRAVKDSGELARIRAAAGVADAALAQVVPMLTEGATERDIALALDHSIRRLGATSNAYETIVASGPNSALPHARPTNRVIGPGDLVVVDVGALVDGYRSDMTRTFVVGEPSQEQARQLDVVREAQAAGVSEVKAGVSATDVDKACRTVIDAAGWADAFSHGTGHGVGLDIHEQPRVNATTSGVLAAGMVVTVEPGVYLPGRGGVRWEDLLHVTDTGAEVLTTSPKRPVVRADGYSASNGNRLHQ